MGLEWIAGAVLGWVVTGFIVSRVYTVPWIENLTQQLNQPTRTAKYAAYYANGIPI